MLQIVDEVLLEVMNHQVLLLIISRDIKPNMRSQQRHRNVDASGAF